MKIVKLYGYFMNNLGDDLMVDALLRRYPKCLFYCTDPKRFCKTFKHHANLLTKDDLYSKFGRLNHLLNIATFNKKKDYFFHRLFARIEKACICSVYIGGSLFMENSNESLHNRMIREYEKLQSRPLFIIGANFGPYYSEDFIAAFEKYFARCAGVTFRDKTTFELFQHLPMIQYAPDVVFNLNPTSQGNNGSVLISIIDIHRRLAIAQYSDQYEKAICQICTACLSQGKKPVLVSFCKEEGDEDAIARIYSKLSEEDRCSVNIFKYRGNIDEAVELFAKADSVVATRFHAMILAICYKKPFYCISYNQKLKNVLQDLNCDAYCEMNNVGNVTGENVLQNMVSLSEVESIFHSAQKQFDQLDRYLHE